MNQAVKAQWTRLFSRSKKRNTSRIKVNDRENYRYRYSAAITGMSFYCAIVSLNSFISLIILWMNFYLYLLLKHIPLQTDYWKP